jgi:nucleotide-binding universal stress UspA family protein
MFRKIIWATDGSELAERALPFAVELASPEGELIAVHVNELLGGRAAGYPLRADEPELEQDLKARVAELREQGVNARLALVKTGTLGAAAALADAADSFGADAIVIGTHGRGAIGSALLGSVARTLLHQARVPVLAVPVLRVAAVAATS